MEGEGSRQIRPAERERALGATGYRTGIDGVELFFRFWQPSTTQAVVLAFHGMGAHGEWYETLAHGLMPRGIATLAPDMRGHGLTRWDLGKVPSPGLLLADAQCWVRDLKSRFPSAPLFVLGTSMGASLAILAAATELELGGLVLLSPAFQPTYLLRREKASMLFSLLFGREGGAATPLGRGLAICGDRLRLEWLRQDPLAQPWLAARSHWNVARLIGQSRAALRQVRVPVLCVQGGLDPVTDPAVNTRLFSKRLGTKYVLWDDAYHDLAQESGDYLSGLVSDWIRHQGMGPGEQ